VSFLLKPINLFKKTLVSVFLKRKRKEKGRKEEGGRRREEGKR
jgi:hypothetical protein